MESARLRCGGVEAEQRARVVAEARTWIGTPYHHHADLKGVGVDCAMILVRVYSTCGIIPAIDPRPYPTQWHLHQSEERYLGWVCQFGWEIEGPPQPGDLAVFRFGRCYAHSGIVVDWPTLIHAWHQSGCEYGSADDGRLAGRPVRFFSLWEA
jgi:cell wall-associated NlpC family hydrolase